ncbi:type VI secretion system-associated protein TagF [Photobacterium makurazakiensis]|uniref:type VI secretion system-associated protein TagF n=1 Tax=Photobacterium makurazakiensis TaxID=2910234 RepID=UPI003D0C60B3
MANFGYFGKVPIRGDFIQDQLSTDFIECWSEWLQAVLAVSREQLGDEWLECYLTSPIWHFALSPGVCGSRSVIGTLMPSVDLVGRHFYFTLAMEVELPPVAFWQDRQWSQLSEQLVLKLLDDDTDLTQWLEGLNSSDWFVALSDTFSTVQVKSEQSNQLVLAGDEILQPSHLLHHAYREHLNHYCIWWTSGSERVSECTLLTNGLPLVSQFSAMLDGNWGKWGW